MHICFISAEYPIKNFSHGGIGTFIRNLGYKLTDENIKVSVIRLGDVNNDEVIDDNGVNVHLLANNSKLPFKFLTNSIIVNKKIAEIHKTNPIDVLETPEIGLAFINKIKGIKYIIRMNGGHHFFAEAENRAVEWKKVLMEKRSFKKADHVIAVSNYVAETTRRLLKLGNIPITILYNPIDTTRFYQSDNSKIEKHSIFFAGTIIEKKGIRQLVQSLEYLVDDYKDIKLYIAGRDAAVPGTNKPYRPILEAAISDRIRPHIVFLGTIPNFEIPQYIENANVCCYPSHMEAMPLAWLEVMAMGKIFIGGDKGPGPEAVQDMITGLLANPYSPEDIAKKIRYVFEHPEEAIAMGINARKKMLHDFDVDIMVKKNIDYFKSIIKE